MHQDNQTNQIFTMQFMKLFTHTEGAKFKQFVLPVLDYAAAVWDPYHLH